MSILFIDGFDTYAPVGNGVSKPDLSCEYTIAGSGAIATEDTTGRFGGGAVTMNSSGGYLQRLLNGGAVFGEVWAGFAYRDTITQNSDTTICTFDSGFGVEIEIRHNNSTGLIKAYRGAGTTLLGTSAVAVATDTLYHFCEVRAVFSPTVGVVEVWIDGTRYLNLTAQNTRNNASATGYSQFTLTNNAVAFSSRKYDDLYILDPSSGSYSTRLGDCRIQTLTPTSDATPNQGTPSTGTTHYTLVDEAGYNTTDYTDLDASSAGNKELFGMSDLSNAQAVYAVKGVSTAWKPDAATVNAASVLKSSSTEVAGPTTALTTNTGSRCSVLAVQDPATSADWTVSGVNAVVSGVKTV